MAARITELVNAVLEQEAGAPPLSGAQVLDLIDLGGSDGGAQARARPPDRARPSRQGGAASAGAAGAAPSASSHAPPAAQRMRGTAVDGVHRQGDPAGSVLARRSPPHAGPPT